MVSNGPESQRRGILSHIPGPTTVDRTEFATKSEREAQLGGSIDQHIGHKRPHGSKHRTVGYSSSCFFTIANCGATSWLTPTNSTTEASHNRTKSEEATSTWGPRLPALTKTLGKVSSERSTKVRSAFRWPNGLMPPVTYPVAFSAACGGAIAADFAPAAAARATIPAAKPWGGLQGDACGCETQTGQRRARC